MGRGKGPTDLRPSLAAWSPGPRSGPVTSKAPPIFFIPPRRRSWNECSIPLPAASNSAEFARVPVSPTVCPDPVLGMRAPGVHLVAEIFRQGTIRETRMGKKADRPDGLKSFDREGMTWLRSNFRGFCPSWFDSNSKRWVRGGGGWAGMVHGLSFFLILRDTWCLRRLGWDEKLKFLHCENFGRFRISWNFGDWTWVARSLRRGSSGIFDDWNKEYVGDSFSFFSMDVFEGLEWSRTRGAVRILGKKRVTPENYTRGNFRFFGESST